MVELLLSHLRDSDHVVVGDYATEDVKDSRLQLVSAMPIDQFIKEATTALTRSKQVKLIYQRAIVTADIRVAKYTVYVRCKQNQTHLCDVYSSAAIEPIPFVEGKGKLSKIKIGNLFVRARFCLIDLWSMKLIINQNRLRGNTAQEKWSMWRIKALLSQFQDVKSQITNTPPKELFQRTDYVGIYEDFKLTKRKMYPGFSSFYYPASQ